MNFLKYFDVRNQKLHFSGKDLLSLSERYGTPLIVYSREKIESNVERIQKAFNLSNLKIHYAMKANFNPSILLIIRELGVGIDATNMNEITLAIRNGFKREAIMANPNNLAREELLEMRDTGVAINFDDISQFNLLKDNPPEVVSFRINPGIGKGEFAGITTGGKGSKFGMPPDAARKAYISAREHGVRRFGIHMHTGSNVLDAEFFRKSTELFFSIAEDISRDADIEFEFVNIGGGLGIPYREDESPLDIDAVASYIRGNMNAHRGLFSSNTYLIIEPGRYIVADAAVLISKVTSIKNYDKYIIGTDTGMNILIRPALYGATHPIFSLNKFMLNTKRKADVVGQICENTDRIGSDIMIQEADEGDTIVTLNAGAYVSSMSSSYNLRPRATEVLIDGDNEYIIRKSDTLEDIISGFSIPDHLKGKVI